MNVYDNDLMIDYESDVLQKRLDVMHSLRHMQIEHNRRIEYLESQVEELSERNKNLENQLRTSNTIVESNSMKNKVYVKKIAYQDAIIFDLNQKYLRVFDDYNILQAMIDTLNIDKQKDS
jgi:dsDNA-specific endonuclease/ATPase MutS2